MKKTIDKGHTQRVRKIMSIIPKDVKTVLDIGCRDNIFHNNYDVTSLDVIEEADIKQDLNLNQHLDLPDNSFDMVVMDQILEHLTHSEELISEAKRVSKKYIYVGLPNEYVLSSRIRFLIGKKTTMTNGYDPYGHKHGYSINTIEQFILSFFNNYESKHHWFIGIGGLLIPFRLRELLAKKIPKFFSGHVYYIINVKSKKTVQEKEE